MDEDLNKKIEDIEKQPPAKKRGRPPKVKTDATNKTLIIDEPPKLPSEELTQAIKQLGGIILDLAAPRLPNPVPFTEQEKKLFNNSLSKVALKYTVNVGKWEEETALLLVTLVLFYPRVKPKKETEKPKEKTPTKTFKEPETKK